jgi:hypothetical protein
MISQSKKVVNGSGTTSANVSLVEEVEESAMKLTREAVLPVALASAVVVVVVAIVAVALYVGSRHLVGQTVMGWSDHYEPSSVEEAQKLAPYDICLPSYLPTGTDPTPTISYLDVWPDNRAELVLKYHQKGATEQFIEIRQWYWASEPPPDLDVAQLEESLVVWLVGWNRAGEILGETTTKIVQSETDGVDRWFIEIVKPVPVEGIVAVWNRGNVTYHMYSVLEIEELARIADSICARSQASP